MLDQKNFKIKSLSYNEYSYANPGTKFYYTYQPSGSNILYSDFFEIYGIKTIEVKDVNAFNEQIYNLIKDWKKLYKPKEKIYDSLHWDLKVELQDETSYRFKGYHEIPENFEKFEEFLNMISKY